MSQDYDIAITPRWGEDSCYGNYLVYLTGAKRRCGYSASVNGGNTAMDRLLTDVAIGGGHEQEALRDLRLLSRVNLRAESPQDVSHSFPHNCFAAGNSGPGEGQIFRRIARPGCNEVYCDFFRSNASTPLVANLAPAGSHEEIE